MIIHSYLLPFYFSFIQIELIFFEMKDLYLLTLHSQDSFLLPVGETTFISPARICLYYSSNGGAEITLNTFGFHLLH